METELRVKPWEIALSFVVEINDITQSLWLNIISRTKYLSFLWVPKHSWLKLLCLMILMFCIFLMCVIDFLIKSWRNHMMGEQNYICNMYNIDLTLCIAAKRLNTSMLFVSLSCFIKWPLPRDTWVEFCYHIALSIHDWSNPGVFARKVLNTAGYLHSANFECST